MNRIAGILAHLAMEEHPTVEQIRQGGVLIVEDRIVIAGVKDGQPFKTEAVDPNDVEWDRLPGDYHVIGAILSTGIKDQPDPTPEPVSGFHDFHRENRENAENLKRLMREVSPGFDSRMGKVLTTVWCLAYGQHAPEPIRARPGVHSFGSEDAPAYGVTRTSPVRPPGQPSTSARDTPRARAQRSRKLRRRHRKRKGRK